MEKTKMVTWRWMPLLLVSFAAVGAGDAPSQPGVFSGLQVGEKVFVRHPMVDDDGFLISNFGEFDHTVVEIGQDYIVLRPLAETTDGRSLLRYIPVTHVSHIRIRSDRN